MSVTRDAGVERSVAALGRNLRFMSGGILGAAVLQYALFFWMARHLGPESYGTFALALTVGVLSTPLCNLGTSVSLVHTCTRDPASLPSVLGASLLWRAILLMPVAASAGVLCWLAGYSDEVSWLVWPLFLASFFDGIGALASAVFQTWERMAFSAGIAILRSVLRCAAFGAVLMTGGGVRELALCYVAASLLAALPPWLPILRVTSIRFAGAPLGRVLRQSAPFAIGVIAVLAHGQIDVAMLGWLCDPGDVGAYHAAMRFLVIAMLIPQLVTQVVSPLVYKIGLQGPAAVARIYHLDTVALGTVGLLGALALALHGDFLVQLLLGPEYVASTALVMAIAPVIFLRFTATPIANALRALGRQSTWGLGCGLALLVNVVANLFLIPSYGALGGVAALAASQLFYVLFLASALQMSGVDLAWRRVFARPLAITAAVALLSTAQRIWPVALPHWALLPTACLLYGALAWRWPIREEHTFTRYFIKRAVRQQPAC